MDITAGARELYLAESMVQVVCCIDDLCEQALNDNFGDGVLAMSAARGKARVFVKGCNHDVKILILMHLPTYLGLQHINVTQDDHNEPMLTRALNQLLDQYVIKTIQLTLGG